MIEKPTAEDLARDAEADLAVCEAATAGPWKRMLCGGSNPNSEVLGIVHARPDLAEKYPPDQYGDIFRVDMVCAAWGMGASDIDFIAMSRTALPAWIKRATEAEARCARLTAAISEHYAQKADDRCWLDDHKLYTAAGWPPHDDSVGDRFAMIANCVRFVTKRCSEGGPWKSYAELESENTRLREALLTFARLAGPADIDPSEDGTGKTTVAEFVKRVLESK